MAPVRVIFIVHYEISVISQVVITWYPNQKPLEDKNKIVALARLLELLPPHQPIIWSFNWQGRVKGVDTLMLDACT